MVGWSSYLLGNEDPGKTAAQLDNDPVKVWPTADGSHDEQVDGGVGLRGGEFREAGLDQAEERLYSGTVEPHRLHVWKGRD